jgi:hypothetical protein
MIIYRSCELYLLTPLSGIYQYTHPVNDILSSVWVVFTDSSEWYLPVYTPCKWYLIICLSCIYWLLKYHLQGVYTGKYQSKEWVNTTHKNDKISLTGVYTGKYHSEEWVNTTLVNDNLSFLWVVFTHSFEWYLPVYTPCKWYLIICLSCIYWILWVIFTSIGKYHSEEWVNTTHKDDKISLTGCIYW